MARPTLRRRVFKALKEGWRQGFAPLGAVEVVAKPVTRPVVAAMEWEEAAFVDGGLRSGRLETEEWGLEDGKSTSV